MEYARGGRTTPSATLTRQEVYQELVKPDMKEGWDPGNFLYAMETGRDLNASTFCYDSVRNISFRDRKFGSGHILYVRGPPLPFFEHIINSGVRYRHASAGDLSGVQLLDLQEVWTPHGGLLQVRLRLQQDQGRDIHIFYGSGVFHCTTNDERGRMLC